MIRNFKKTAIFLISILIMQIFIPVINVYATNEQINTVIEQLPESIQINVNKKYVENDNNFILYKDIVSQTIADEVKKTILNYVVENNLIDKIATINYEELNPGNSKNKVDIYLRGVKNSDTYLDYTGYINLLEEGYLSYYYDVSYRGEKLVKEFKVYLLDDEENTNYEQAMNFQKEIEDNYRFSIGEIYNWNKECEGIHLLSEQTRMLLEKVNVKETDSVKFDIYTIKLENYESNTTNLNYSSKIALKIKVNDNYYAIKVVNLITDNAIIIPTNIDNETESIIEYLEKHLKEKYFTENEIIKVEKINEDYILTINPDTAPVQALLDIKRESFEYGMGTRENPYIINTVRDLNNVRYHLNSYFRLNADIDLTEATSSPTGELYDNGKGWLPIASDIVYDGYYTYSGDKFSGSFDGNGHTIYGLYINRVDNQYNGLFGYISDKGQVKNLILKDINIISGKRSVGTVASYNEGNIHNIKVYGNIEINYNESSFDYIGGIVGNNYGNIYKCINYANIKSTTNDRYGEIQGAGIAAVNNGYIYECMNWGDITIKRIYKSEYQGSNTHAAGIVGLNNEVVFNVANIGTLTGNNVSGIMGTGYYPVFNAYNIGTLYLYKDSYTGNEEIIDSMYIDSIAPDDPNTEDKKAYGIYGYNPDKIYATLVNEKEINYNNVSIEQFDTFDFEKVWTIKADFLFPTLQGIEIDPIEKGDINKDGEINARDAKLAIQHFTGKTTLTGKQILATDVNKDGQTNARDAKLIIQFFTGKISSF